MLKINSYFEGKVASIGLQTATLPATIGVMDIGEYKFSSAQHEVMSVIDGQLIVKLANSDDWNTYHSGDSFEVSANSSFEVRVEVQTAYFCTYENK